MAILSRALIPMLLPYAADMRLSSVELLDQTFTIHLTTTTLTACCPGCQQSSRRVHSHYTRSPADLPWATCAVKLVLRVRKFFCTNPSCAQRIFVERVPQLVAPYARRTLRLQRVTEAVALALGGEAGARLLAVLNVVLSSATLLNTIRATAPRATSAPRALGIDDWSWRRGHRFGTILVDLEQHAVIDLLPDRTVTTVTDWLKQQPHIEVIARDRAKCYAEAAVNGAPQALQVVDRWHLLVRRFTRCLIPVKDGKGSKVCLWVNQLTLRRKPTRTRACW